jgi:tetratricopeptide (TPR) repeat protein
MMACLDDEAMLGLVEGRLKGAALAEAEGHLDGCESCRDVVAQMSRAAAPAGLAPGRELGGYVVGELLGEGAMGRVYEAWQRELDRKVAIKVLHDQSTAKLLKEAQAMARLDHPNVVGVYEVGTVDDAVYVVMDLVTGDTLRAWAPKRTPAEITRVLVEIARGLAAVHAAGVIHRDIKPDNIIVGSDGRARLGDFGLARGAGNIRGGNQVSASSTSFEDTVVATPGDASRHAVSLGANAVPAGTAVAGTPVYMALEVLKGGAATAASDQFAFGVTAYEIIAGERPFTGKSWDALARSVERDQPPQLETVPGWLDAAIRRCLAIDPAKRWPSMTALADHLAERAQRRKPIWIAGAAAAAVIASGVTFAATRGSQDPSGPTCTAGADEIAAVWNRDARAKSDKLGGLVLAAIDGWAAQWATEHDATCAASRSEPIAKIAARENCLLRRRDELTSLLSEMRRLAPAELPSTMQGLRVSDPQLDERMMDALGAMSPIDCRTVLPGAADPMPPDPALATEARTVEQQVSKVRAAIALGDAARQTSLVTAMVDRAKQSTHLPTVAAAHLVHAEVLRATGRLDEAAIAARDAVAAAERGHDDQTVAHAWLTRVGIAADKRDFAAADDLAAIASATVDRAGAPARWIARLLQQRGLIAFYRNKLGDARTLLTDARAKFVALSGERSTDVAAIETLLGGVARVAGDLAAAEKHHRLALSIDREVRPPSHPDLSRDLHNVAGILRLQKDLDGALTAYHEALALETARNGERSVQAGLTHNSIGLVKLERKEHAAARREFQLALSILTDAHHGDRAFAEHNLGLVDAAQGDHAAALAHYDAAAAIYDATVGDAAVAAIRIHLDRARSLLATKQGDAARASATRAIEAATTAGIPWIVDDAKALFAGKPKPMRTPLKVPGKPIPGQTANEWRPPPVEPPPLPPIPNPPKPVRDVGTYGTSPGTP